MIETAGEVDHSSRRCMGNGGSRVEILPADKDDVGTDINDLQKAADVAVKFPDITLKCSMLMLLEVSSLQG